MMKITGANVTAFIQFLYKTKLSQEADQEVIDSWTGLSDEEASTHLNLLFAHWQYDENQIRTVFNDYERTINPLQKSEQNFNHPVPEKQTQFVPRPVEINGNRTSPSVTIKKKGSRSAKILLGIVLVAVAFLIYKFQQFKSLDYVYVTTDNVTIRNHEGKAIGRMDIFAAKNSVSFLRAADHKSYPIVVGDKEYLCRKVLLDSTSFSNFLWNKNAAFGFVNENYLISEKDNFILYRNVFKLVNQNATENAALQSKHRNVLVGSLKLDPSLEQFYVSTACNSKNKKFSNIYKHETRPGNLQIIAQLSNGNYYIFTGNAENKDYLKPQILSYRNPYTNEQKPFQNEQLLFRKESKGIGLYDCKEQKTGYQMLVDGNNVLQMATYIPEPTILLNNETSTEDYD